MPEICRFFGIIVKMFFGDHSPPHFHAYYGEHEALIDIHNLSIFAGRLPPRAIGLVIELFAYVLMNNRYHLLLHTPRANLSRAMQWFDSAGFEPFHKSARSLG